MADAYLVQGAKIKCLCGTMSGELDVENRNVALLRAPVATEDDCVSGINLPGFGICRITGEFCLHMIPDKWLLPHPKTTIDGKKAITTKSGLLCARGGLIVAETSGQETISALLHEVKRKYNLDLYGLNRCSPYSSDPVNLCTGNFVLEKDDIKIRGIYPLKFTRTYNSLSKIESDCGIGWSHNHQIYLERKSECIQIHLGNGGQVRTFEKTKSGYQTREEVKESFISMLYGFEYRDIKKNTYLFNEDGLCTEIKDKDGNTTAYTYENSKVVKVENISGTLLFSYDDMEQLYRVSDHTDRTIKLEYENGQLKCVTNLLGGSHTYTYDENNKLIEEITPYGVKKVVNQYDTYGRTIKQEFPNQSTMSYEYDDSNGKLTMTQPNGDKFRFYHDKWQQNRRITYAEGRIEKGYNDSRQLIWMTDCNGNKTSYQYDDTGNIISKVDAEGYETRLVYSRNNYPIKAIFPDGSEMRTDYDLKGRVLKNTDQLGRYYQYEYNKVGMVEKIIHPDGSQMQMSFDNKGNIIQVLNPFGSKIQYKYDALNRVTTAVDGKGNRTQFYYNENNDVVKMTNALGYSKEYRYNLNGKVIEIIDEDECSTVWEYNELDYPIKKTDKEGRESYQEYDCMWNVCRETEANGAVTKYIYSKSNRLEAVISPEGAETKYAYDGNGNCIKEIRPDGGVLTFSYDGLNRLIQTDYPNQTSSYQKYNYAGKVTEFIDPKGGVHLMEYDAAGQQIKRVTPDGKVTYFEYNELGLVTKVVEPPERVMEYEYLSGGRLKRITFPDGSFLDYAYDCNANVISKHDQNGKGVTFTYDALNRLIRLKNSKGQTKSFVYDEMSNIISITNSKDIETSYEYTPSGKLQSVIEPTGTKTYYLYDDVDKLLSVRQTEFFDNDVEEVQRLSRQRDRLLVGYQRNLEGHVISSRDGMRNETLYQRDFCGRILTETDPEGKETHYSYDPVGNLKKILYSDGKKVQMEYDAINQLIQLNDWLGTTSIERSCQGAPVSVTDYQGNTMHYEWDSYGKRTKTIYPDGKEISYQYDAKSQRLLHMEWDDAFVDYQYNKEGYLIEKKYSNGKHSSYGYNSNGQLSCLTHSYEWGLLKYQYEYDLEGLPTRVYEQSEAGDHQYRYQYDEAGRIEKVFDGLHLLREYGYDSFGNRISLKEGKQTTDYQYNDNNQVIQKVSGELVCRYEYDKRGNIQSIYENDELNESFSYDGRNMLERLRKRAEGTTAYTYDGFGHRVKRVRSEREPEQFTFGLPQERELSITEFTIDYLRNDHNVIREKSDSGQHTQQYIWEPDSHLLVGLVQNNKNYFYQNDWLGSPVRLLDQKGKAVNAYDYDEFGSKNDKGVNDWMSQPFGYVGYYQEEKGLYHTEKRYYNSDIGLFYGQDIIKGNTLEPVTMHPYLLCWNSPLYFVDLDGADPGKWRTVVEGAEAHLVLEGYFFAHYAFIPNYYPETEVKIKGGGRTSATDGRADMVLTIQDGYTDTVQVFELKPVSHMKAPVWLESDKQQIEGYIRGLKVLYISRNIRVERGTVFDPSNVYIPSAIHPGWYYQFYTKYGEVYTTETDDYYNYNGMIYYRYIKDEKLPKTATCWEWVKEGKKAVAKDPMKEYDEEALGVATVVLVAGGFLLFGPAAWALCAKYTTAVSGAATGATAALAH